MRIAFLLYEGLSALDIIGPYEVLRFVPGVEICFVSKNADEITLDSGALSLNAPYSFKDVTWADVLVIPGSGNSTFRTMCDGEILEWIRMIDEKSLYTTSVCTGSMILGAAGLLQGKKATTHWFALEALTKLGAEPVSLERVVKDGKIITAAGVSAGIDMALELAALIGGDQSAKTAQLAIEYDPDTRFKSGNTFDADKATIEEASVLMGKNAKIVREGLAMTKLRLKGKFGGKKDYGYRLSLLEKEHVQYQDKAIRHLIVHVKMFFLALRYRAWKEVLGQLPRILLAVPGSVTGRAPLGNVGSTRMGIFEKALPH